MCTHYTILDLLSFNILNHGRSLLVLDPTVCQIHNEIIHLAENTCSIPQSSVTEMQRFVKHCIEHDHLAEEITKSSWQPGTLTPHRKKHPQFSQKKMKKNQSYPCQNWKKFANRNSACCSKTRL